MKYLHKIINLVAKIFGFSCVFVEVRGVHLGHTLIESAYANFFKPIFIIFQRPEANKWLCEKIKKKLPTYKIFSSDGKKSNQTQGKLFI